MDKQKIHQNQLFNHISYYLMENVSLSMDSLNRLLQNQLWTRLECGVLRLRIFWLTTQLASWNPLKRFNFFSIISYLLFRLYFFFDDADLDIKFVFILPITIRTQVMSKDVCWDATRYRIHIVRTGIIIGPISITAWNSVSTESYINCVIATLSPDNSCRVRVWKWMSTNLCPTILIWAPDANSYFSRRINSQQHWH